MGNRQMRYSEIIENMDHSKDGRAVEELRAALEAHKDKLQDATDDQVYDIIDKIMTRIAKSHSISGQKLHDMWVDKYKQIPDTWIMNEAFDQPYKGKWEKSDYGDVDLNTKLPDGTYLNIMFNQEYDGDGNEVTQVEFHRNNSQEVTGEGDAQRIFATVLDAIQKYIKKYKPQKLSFSASKSVDMDADDNGAKFNPESRAKLYDRLVQRYSKAWGYRAFRADNGDIVIYELSRLKQGVAESKTVEYNGLTLRIKKPTSYELRVEALDDWGNKVLGYVEFDIGDGKELDPQDLRVDDKYQGQGIAKTMYDYVKQLGYTIVRSWDQTDAGAGFWDKHRGEDVRVWENFHDGRNPQDKGDSKRHGVPTKASISTLRKVAKQGGRKGQLAHWMANMKSGRAKAKRK
jgi:GNAT superfamily N-acetyltransferase